MQNTSSIKTQAKTGNSQSSSTRPNRPNTNSTSRPPQGKSKYANKARANKNRKPVAVKSQTPVFSYVSGCCNVAATKKPCVAVGKKEALAQTLGKFRCGACGKRCKCTRTLYVTPETQPAVQEVAIG